MKSHSSDYLKVVQAIYKDACTSCAAEVSFRDLKTIRSRVESQGVSFLTITLPNFCKDFERSLELGFVDSNLFQSFRKRRSIPAFLQGMISRIFNMETGRINDEITCPPTYLARTVDSIRQICLAFKKIELPCTLRRENKALESFIVNENSFKMFSLSDEDSSVFTDVSFMLWSRHLRNICVSDLVPKHGPGQTAERITGNRKYVWRLWHDRIEPYLPLVGSAYSSISGGISDPLEELELVTIVPEDQEQPVRVTPVPKTLKGPRIIAIEPCCMQYAQQAIRDRLYDVLEKTWPFAGHINFRDQSINQRLALMSSSDGQLATIDLSDASDRVPRDLALRLFDSNPDLRDFIDACRSKSAEMPDGTIVPLSKFASMGSALCFPVEAMYFYTICIVALLKDRNLPVSRKNIEFVSSGVYVYGDDILVPSHSAATVLDYLQKYNCRVNTSKTFYRGSFRESCGVDAFLGEQVNPVYIGTKPPENRQQATELISWTATANLFLKKGYRRVAHFLFSKVEKILGNLPTVSENAPVLGRIQPWEPFFLPTRWNRRFQRKEILCWAPTPVYRTDKLEGFGALMKCLLKLERLPESGLASESPFNYETYIKSLVDGDPLHLERSALHGEVAIHRRWVPATLVSGYRQ